VDGLLTAGVSPSETAEYLGIKPTFVDGTSVGGASFVIHVGHAAAALAAGGPDARLIVPRIAVGPATCALAATEAGP